MANDDTFDVLFQQGFPLGPIRRGYTFEQEIICWDDEALTVFTDLDAKWASYRFSAKERATDAATILDSAGGSPNCSIATAVNVDTGETQILKITISNTQSAALPARIEGVYEIKGITPAGRHELLFSGPLLIDVSVVPPT